ncbi:MAG: diaminopimelate epimerase [Acholeplasmatales bacterium]|nr:diaminopimelate epimerase [Acholeplasmatales bacterium]
MSIRFTKMHGCGNDYIYINCFNQNINDPEKLAIEMSERHFSVGSDGLVLIMPSNVADARMRMFNADGSEGNMCGNAIRCIGKYLYDNQIVSKDVVKVETLSGIKTLHLCIGDDGKVSSVTVNMGQASFKPEDIGLADDTEYINKKTIVKNKEYEITAVSMGNPHCVTYVDNVKILNLLKDGPFFENNPLFKNRVNTEFVKVISKNHLEMRVWERGSGETYACGTGACAICAASVKNGICDFNTEINVDLLGGTLKIKVLDDYTVMMTGPAKIVYEGVYYED